ncbi:MAG: urea ABC transporter permease subunit UrtB, partial [Pseudomonadota bacterium]
MLRHLLLSAAFFLATGAHALTADEVKGMTLGEVDTRIEALNKAAVTADEKTTAFIQAMSDDAVKFKGDKVFVVRDDKAFDPVTGAETPLPADAEDVINPNLMRGELDTALAALKLFNKDEKVRRDAIKTLAGENDEARLPLIEKAYAVETVPALKSQLELVRAAIFLGSSDKAKRLEAAAQLSGSNNPNTKTVLL